MIFCLCFLFVSFVVFFRVLIILLLPSYYLLLICLLPSYYLLTFFLFIQSFNPKRDENAHTVMKNLTSDDLCRSNDPCRSNSPMLCNPHRSATFSFLLPLLLLRAHLAVPCGVGSSLSAVDATAASSSLLWRMRQHLQTIPQGTARTPPAMRAMLGPRSGKAQISAPFPAQASGSCACVATVL